MEHSRDLLGDPLTIKFYQYGKVVQHFSGIITKIHCKRKAGGGYGTLYISGNAPSILLDSGKECQSYENRTLQEIVAAATEEYDESAKVDTSAGVNTTRTLPYTVQYQESDYDFICRLAKYYGEYFYYDGSKLIFGNKLQETIDLGENLNLIDEEFFLEVKPQDFQYINYNIHQGTSENNDSRDAANEYKNNPIQTDAKNASKKIYKKIPQKYHSATSLEQSSVDLEDVVRLEKDKRELLLRVKGQSRDPRLRMNTFACLTDINARAMETYRVVKISHYHSGMEYYNSFEGIPMMRTPADFDENAFPHSEQQPAIVKDNNDPLGMGRVRVQFLWQAKRNEMTPWIRVVQPYTGGGKGFYFVPEIGEEVLVDFEGGNAERPFVIGAHYNGEAKSGYTPTTKAIHTKSGTKILLNDAEGSVRIEDPSGNIYAMDGKGNIKVQAPKNITFVAGENISLRATASIDIDAGVDISETAGAMINKNAIGDYSLIAANITEIARGERKARAKQVVDQSKNAKLISEQKNEVHSKGKFSNNSGESTNIS